MIMPWMRAVADKPKQAIDPKECLNVSSRRQDPACGTSFSRNSNRKRRTQASQDTRRPLWCEGQQCPKWDLPFVAEQVILR